MPVLEQGHAHAIVRRAKANRGRVKMYLRCEPRFNYCRSGHTTTLRKSDVFFTSEGADKAVLRLRQ
jgi:hypothetical protein